MVSGPFVVVALSHSNSDWLLLVQQPMYSERTLAADPQATARRTFP